MYFPKSQIKTNLYTNGYEYILISTKEKYKGYYYEISNGKKYTGKNPQDGPNTQIIPIPPVPLLFQKGEVIEGLGEQFISTNNNPPIVSAPPYSNNIANIRYIPQFNPTLPTDQDKQNGQFIRYFCAKTNELRYFEIDKLTYDKLSTRDSQIAWDLYLPASLTWRIKGDKEQVYNSNKGAVITIEQNLKWAGFSQYFQDKFLKYYLES